MNIQWDKYVSPAKAAADVRDQAWPVLRPSAFWPIGKKAIRSRPKPSSMRSRPASSRTMAPGSPRWKRSSHDTRCLNSRTPGSPGRQPCGSELTLSSPPTAGFHYLENVMPWYSTGTVSVVLNSDTVTGSGTAFSANARAGDAFRGPDGRWYEIGNVTSATVLTIKPAYQGATANGQAYSITPVQGYSKTLADQFRDLSNQWGSLLAAVKPWAIASTGSQAQADMGITEVGRAINGASTVGNALGFGRCFQDPSPHGPGYGHGERKRMVLDNPNTYNVPLGNNNISGVNGHVALSMVFDASTRYQLFFVRNTNLPEVWYRSCTNGTWKEWVRFIRQTISWGP